MSRSRCPSYAIGIIRSGSRPPRIPRVGIFGAFVSAPEAGPPVQAAYVRVTAIQGSWTLVPTRGGGSLVTYVVASDPGGSLPVWLTNRAQRNAVPALVKAMLDRVKHTLPREGE